MKKVFVIKKNVVITPKESISPVKPALSTSLEERRAALLAELNEVEGKGDPGDDTSAPVPSREAHTPWQKLVASLFDKYTIKYVGTTQVYVAKDDFNLFVKRELANFHIETSFDTAVIDLHGVREAKLKDAILFVLSGKKFF